MSETVAIHHPHDPLRPTVIPADRYDPDVHRLWDDSGSDEPEHVDVIEEDEEGEEDGDGA